MWKLVVLKTCEKQVSIAETGTEGSPVIRGSPANWFTVESVEWATPRSDLGFERGASKGRQQVPQTARATDSDVYRPSSHRDRKHKAQSSSFWMAESLRSWKGEVYPSDFLHHCKLRCDLAIPL